MQKNHLIRLPLTLLFGYLFYQFLAPSPEERAAQEQEQKNLKEQKQTLAEVSTLSKTISALQSKQIRYLSTDDKAYLNSIRSEIDTKAARDRLDYQEYDIIRQELNRLEAKEKKELEQNTAIYDLIDQHDTTLKKYGKILKSLSVQEKAEYAKNSLNKWQPNQPAMQQVKFIGDTLYVTLRFDENKLSIEDDDIKLHVDNFAVIRCESIPFYHLIKSGITIEINTLARNWKQPLVYQINETYCTKLMKRRS